MGWTKLTKGKVRSKPKYSIIENLRNQNKSDDRFELMVELLSLEDLIALKLELSSRSANYALYGFPFWRIANQIVKEAIFKYAMKSCASPKEVYAFLSIDAITLMKLKRKYLQGLDIRKIYRERKLKEKEQKDNEKSICD